MGSFQNSHKNPVKWRGGGWGLLQVGLKMPHRILELGGHTAFHRHVFSWHVLVPTCPLEPLFSPSKGMERRRRDNESPSSKGVPDIILAANLCFLFYELTLKEIYGSLKVQWKEDSCHVKLLLAGPRNETVTFLINKYGALWSQANRTSKFKTNCSKYKRLKNYFIVLHFFFFNFRFCFH